MGHKNNKTLVKQVQDALDARLAIGERKYIAKQIRLPDGRTEAQARIYSWGTYKSYMAECNRFAQWCKETHKCKTLQQCREHVDEWLQLRIDAGLSAYTIKLDVSALAKLYDCAARDLTSLETPSRARKDITRSRVDRTRDKHFSDARNADLVTFCQSTGLRRSELEQLRGTDFCEDGGGVYIHVRKGKGGKERYAPVVGDVELVRRLCAAAGDGAVWGRVHSAADIHAWRRDYAQAVYDLHRRQDADIPRDSKNRYYCRKDRKGEWFDRPAMVAASRALGHNRECVVGEHYLSHG